MKISKISEPRHRNVLYLSLSFLLPVIIMGTVFAVKGVYPFGNRQILVVDFWHQYFPLLSDFWHKLRSGESLLWSWTTSDDYFGHMAYYLSSPLNLLITLFPHSWLREVVTSLLLVKIGCAGLFMGMYLKYTFKRCDYSTPVFAMLYALCGFTLGYYWNIIWFDTVALLPLVALGVQSIIDKDKYRLYIISLALSVFASFLLGIFTCAFSVIVFFSYTLIKRTNKKVLIKKLLWVALYSVIALGLTAVLMIPTYSALQNIYSANSGFPKGFKFYHSTFEILSKFNAFSTPNFKEGLPNIFSGSVCIFLFAIFLRSNKISIREKIVYLSLTSFLILSCNMTILNYIWHGFRFTNMLNYRFSFLISFITIVMAYRAYTIKDEIDKWDLLCMSGFAITFLAFSYTEDISSDYMLGRIVLYIIYFLSFYISAITNIKRITKYVFNFILLAAVITEASFMADISVTGNRTTTHADYPLNYEQVQRLKELREPMAENDFYRTDFTSWYSVNDPSLYGTKGFSFFSSTVNVDLTRFLLGLGVTGAENGGRHYFGETSPLTSTILNIRYFIDKNNSSLERGTFFNLTGEVDDAHLLENKYHLPLGFMVNKDTADYTHDDSNPFISQNNLFRLATGLDEDLFTFLEITGDADENCTALENSYSEYSFSFKNEANNKLRFNYTAPKDCTIYAYAKIDSNEKISIMRDDKIVYSPVIKLPYIFTVGNFEADEEFSLSATIDGYSGNAKIFVAYINHELFERGYNILNKETLSLTKFTGTRVEGNVTASEDGLLYTSIPNANRWNAYVNGERRETVLIDGCMSAVYVEKGENLVELRYQNPSFTIGIFISSISLAVFIAFIIIDTIKRRNI